MTKNELKCAEKLPIMAAKINAFNAISNKLSAIAIGWPNWPIKRASGKIWFIGQTATIENNNLINAYYSLINQKI